MAGDPTLVTGMSGWLTEAKDVLFIVSAWCHVKGALRTADDRPYDYPFQIRVLS